MSQTLKDWSELKRKEEWRCSRQRNGREAQKGDNVWRIADHESEGMWEKRLGKKEQNGVGNWRPGAWGQSKYKLLGMWGQVWWAMQMCWSIWPSFHNRNGINDVVFTSCLYNHTSFIYYTNSIKTGKIFKKNSLQSGPQVDCFHFFTFLQLFPIHTHVLTYLQP